MGRIERTLPFFFSHRQTLDVGIDRSTPVTTYPRGRGFAFTGDDRARHDQRRRRRGPGAQRDELDAILVAQ